MKSHYRHNEAGYHIETNLPVIDSVATAHDAIDLIKKNANTFTTINYIYLKDSSGKLVGVVSLRELFQAPSMITLSDFCTKSIVTARPHTDQARVARLALRHSLKAVPVVDADHVFLGAVTSDTILQILDDEHQQYLLRDSGISTFGKETVMLSDQSIGRNIFMRVPWLLVGLIGGAVAAVVVAYFEEAIATVVLLAAFIPAVVYLADAVGSQTQTLLIRLLALFPDTSYKKYLVRELLVTVGIATCLTLFVGVAIWGFGFDMVLVYILTLTTALTILVTTIISVSLPFVFKRFGSDPAIASGPLATVVRDVSSLLIYFAVAISFI
ncbi:MAG: magnesium transporter [Candidatus Paceibacteria bacterium]